MKNRFDSVSPRIRVQRKGEVISCKIKRISADALEDTVIKHLGRILLRAGYFDGIEKNIRESNSNNGKQINAEIALAEKAIKELDIDIRGAFRIQSSIDASSESFRLVIEQMDELAKQKKELTKRIDHLKDLSANDKDLSDSIDNIKNRLAEVERGWVKMTVAQKKRLIRRLISSLEVHPDKVGINYFIANGNEGLEPLEVDGFDSNKSQNGEDECNIIPFKNKRPEFSNLLVQNLRVVKNGDPGTI